MVRVSQSATVLTNGAKVLKEGTNSKGAWKLYGLKDEYDEIFGTWFNDASLAREINDAAGTEIEVEFDQDGDRKTIKSIGSPPLAQDEGPAPATAGPSSSLPETAWLCAATMAKADLGWDAAKKLADRILADLKLKHGIDPDDIPF